MSERVVNNHSVLNYAESEEVEQYYENQEERKSSESEKASEQRHKLSLKFLCEDTPPSDRRICETFWQMIDQHPEISQIMVTGQSEHEEVPKKIPKLRPVPKAPCDHLQEFMAKDVDKLVVAGLKAQEALCITKQDSEASLMNLSTEMKEFDFKLVTEYSIPPKTPRPTPSLLKMTKSQNNISDYTNIQ